MSEPSVKKQPKIVTYMGSLYELMSSEATEVSTDGAEPVLVWQGKLIETCTKVGIPQGYYKKVVDALRGMGCIEMITQGRRGNTPTTIALRYPPTHDRYEKAIVKSGWDDLTRTPSPDRLAAELNDLRERTGGLHIPSIVQALDERLSNLEAAVKDLRQQSQQPQDQSVLSKQQEQQQ